MTDCTHRLQVRRVEFPIGCDASRDDVIDDVRGLLALGAEGMRSELILASKAPCARVIEPMGFLQLGIGVTREAARVRLLLQMLNANLLPHDDQLTATGMIAARPRSHCAHEMPPIDWFA